MNKKAAGGFTLPGEAGYEKLTLELAERWGADVIRDSDGTDLSDDIINAGYGIYSTICVIRDHNEWAKAHPEQIQQTFLVTEPCTATKECDLEISLMNDFFEEQFRVNDDSEAMEYWQVYDRTENIQIPKERWTYDAEKGTVLVLEAISWHQYTVSFLAYRVWEEISMYNHVTNNWEKEHLIPIDPRFEETREYLYHWLNEWCKNHPTTTVVRFTSLFYNFVWMWGSDERKRSIFSDWGSYDFTVSPKALKEFESQYGYALTAEDFINQGKFHVTHIPVGKHQLDYMEFINHFVVTVGKKMVDLVHSYGKKAYVFYDDSWIGLEPYHEDFKKFGFDGLIKCVFSGYEARLCAGAEVETHELRLHPYLFPVGLGGAPTFQEGGDPVQDAQVYWKHVRRALLREDIERIGLGGYLHLVEDYPDFVDYMEKLANEFRFIKGLHKNSSVYKIPLRVSVLHFWGKLRSWTLSGHFHETYMHDLIHVNEALAGLPVDVKFISFEDIKSGALNETDVLINAGAAGTAWSGGAMWEETAVIEKISQFAYEGGLVIGVNEPSALEGYHAFFRLSDILGVDKDTGARVCHGKWSFKPEHIDGLIPGGSCIKENTGIYLTDKNTKVLAEKDGCPLITFHSFGKGGGIYLSSFRMSSANARLLLNLMLYGKGMELQQKYITDNSAAECAWYPEERCLLVMNNSGEVQNTSVETEMGIRYASMEPYDMVVMNL